MLMNKPNLSRNYITLQNPYNKQVLLSKFAFFDSDQFIAKLSRSHQFDLQQFIVFCRFFQELKIDLYQNQSDMLTARKS